MSRNKIIALILVVIVFVSIILYFLFRSPVNTPTTSNTDTGSLFPDVTTNNTTSTTTQTGDGETSATQTNQGEETLPESEVPATVNKLVEISKNPTAGAIAVLRNGPTPIDPKAPTPKIVAVFYANKSNGFVFERTMDNLSLEKRITSTTVPHIEDASFLNDAHNVIMRYLNPEGETVQTFVGTLPKEVIGGDSAPILSGYFLSENIKELTVSGDGQKFFHLFDYNGTTAGTLTTIATNKKNQFFQSSFSEWLPMLSNNGGLLFMNTKPSSGVLGFLYQVTPPSTTLTKVLGSILGLTSMPNGSGSTILYADNQLSLKSINIKNKKVTVFGIKTLPEKCVWAADNITLYCFIPNNLPNAAYPDSWYQGIVSFSDSIWKINTDTGATSFLDNISNHGDGVFDAIKPFLAPDESTIFFINKNDYSLWGYRLKNDQS